jgi:TolB-like protein
MKTFVVAVLLCASSAFAGESIVLVPFDDFSGSETAQAEVTKHFTAALQKRGWTVVAGGEVEAILEKERVRYLDPLETHVIGTLTSAMKASLVLTGTIYTYVDGPNPTVAIAARINRADGSLRWADIVSLSAGDTERMLGFGKKSNAAALVELGVRQLAAALEAGGKPPHSRGRSSAAAFRDREFDVDRVCVLPFENLSSNPDASRVVADVLSLRLNLEVVDQAALRASAIESHIGSFRTIATDDLVRLAEAVGTPYFIRGTIYQYVDPTARAGGEAELQVELSLIDVREKRVLWASQHGRRGADYTGFLMQGRVTTAVGVADRVLSEMVKTNEANSDRKRPSHQQRVSELRGGKGRR